MTRWPDAPNTRAESVVITVLVEQLGVLSGDRMRAVCSALDVAVDC